jgi:uncharacterized membrane protein
VSFLVIIAFMMPQLATGRNMVVTGIVGSLLILAPTYLLTYGPSRKTALAFGATIGTLAAALLMAHVFSGWLDLTGAADDDALNFAIAHQQGGAFLFSLLIAGMIIGVLGVIDDVIIAQISIVEELRHANPNLSRFELYRRAMRVGNDHIASVVNTLVLAYAGASLPIFLFFTSDHQPLGMIVSDEAVATEIVRMFVGTISLVLAVPLATILASVTLGKRV